MKIFLFYLTLAFLFPAVLYAQDSEPWKGKWAEESTYLLQKERTVGNLAQETGETSPYAGIWHSKWAEESGRIMDHHGLEELEDMFNPRPRPATVYVDNVAIVEKLYADLNKGDISAIQTVMAPAIEWREAENFPYSGDNPYIGFEAIREGVINRLATEWESWRFTDLQYDETTDGKVVVTGRCQGKYKENGERINLQISHLWELKDGKVIRVRQFADSKGIADAMNR